MKIAVPVVNGKLCMHFGHCQQFAIVDVDMENRVIRSTDYLDPPPHEPGVLPKWLSEKGANCIIAGGMGGRAQGLFQQMGIDVVTGAPSAEPEKVVGDFINDKLETGANACDH